MPRPDPFNHDPDYMPDLAYKLLDHVQMHVNRGLAEKGWKTKDLARELGIATHQLDQVMMDATRMTIGRLAKIMEALEVDAVIADRKDLRDDLPPR